MTAENKIALLIFRLHKLSVNGKDNPGVQRRIRREIRNLEKKLN